MQKWGYSKKYLKRDMDQYYRRKNAVKSEEKQRKGLFFQFFRVSV
jgi:hypothetical protein